MSWHIHDNSMHQGELVELSSEPPNRIITKDTFVEPPTIRISAHIISILNLRSLAPSRLHVFLNYFPYILKAKTHGCPSSWTTLTTYPFQHATCSNYKKSMIQNSITCASEGTYTTSLLLLEPPHYAFNYPETQRHI